MLLIVSISVAVTFATFIALQHANAKVNEPKTPRSNNIAVLFIVFLMTLIGLHYMGVGSGASLQASTRGGNGRIDAYEDSMIKTIAEDCFVGNPPF